MQPGAGARIRCRQIGPDDLDAIADLLTRGFPGRRRDYWRRGLTRLGERAPPEFPTYGYMLEHDGRAVGVILLLFALDGAANSAPRCNLSSWYVEPAFRGHASLLIALALKHKNVTYTNISPAPHTWSTVEAMGFIPYCRGQFFALPILSGRSRGVRIRRIEEAHGGSPERDLLAAHASFGCTSLVCVADDGEHPFIFQPFRIRRGRVPLPCMRLVYCHDVADFVRFARPLGAYLLGRGMPLVAVDSNGPVPGLVGAYVEEHGRKYFRGPIAPRLGDLAFSELVLFGP